MLSNRRLPMSRTSVGLVVLILASILSVGVASAVFQRARPPVSPNVADVRLGGGDSLKVSFVGDSIDLGFYATDPGLGFHALVVNEWRNTGPVADFPMKALVGGTARDVLKNSDLPDHQNLLVVELGTNDVVRVDRHDFRAEYATVLDRLQGNSPSAALVCLGAWRPKTSGGIFDLIIKDLCEIRGGVFVPLSDLAADQSLRGPANAVTFGGPSDDFHPNNEGHRKIADRVLAAIRVYRGGR